MSYKLFLLIKEDVSFSKQEVLALYKPKKHELIGDILVFKTKKSYAERLSLTKEIYEVINITKKELLEEELRKVNWEKVISGSYAFRSDDKKSERSHAANIYRNLKKPVVDLRRPDTLIQVFIREEKAFICVLEKKISTSWKNRKSHLKPEPHPTSLSPRIARAMINLGGETKGVLCDPFCGSGGILLESGLLGYKPVGFDIDKIMINRSKINLDYYKIRKYELINKSALDNKKRFSLVVSDLPYARNSKASQELNTLFLEFFNKYYSLSKTMIVGLPNFLDYKKLIGPWKVKNEFEVYLHKSLSKKVLVLKK
ncbi:hypothetical protein GOV05_05025 [Candidatus Woesearchaeota archaeon]|nr:hypothetical protein [Candidatus Woesearchaeota archaeon]